MEMLREPEQGCVIPWLVTCMRDCSYAAGNVLLAV